MTGAMAAWLPGERLHLQHGPIDLVIGLDGADAERRAGFAAAQARFATVLDELVPELPVLRRAIGPLPTGQIARQMHTACARHAGPDCFVTPMAAVAGAVADTVLGAITDAARLDRAYVNNGGDIALFLGKTTQYVLNIAGLDGADLGRVTLHEAHPVRGIATSGAGGRSLSMGIADSVTVLARDAASADVAATLIANAVDLPGHPSITRLPANAVQPDSDLGARPVVRGVAALAPFEVAEALDAGARLAGEMARNGLIHGAALMLRGQARVAGQIGPDMMVGTAPRLDGILERTQIYA